MNITYKQANLDDIELLVKSRIIVLREANHLDDSADMSEVKAQSYDYYRKDSEWRMYSLSCFR